MEVPVCFIEIEDPESSQMIHRELPISSSLDLRSSKFLVFLQDEEEQEK